MKTFDIIKPIRGSHKHLALAVAMASGLAAGTALAAPANDNFAAAIDLTGAGAGQTGTVNTGTQTGTVNVDATSESGETLAHGMTKTVWFKWTCPADGSFTVNTSGSTTATPTEWDAVLGIYTGTAVNALTPLNGSPQDGVELETMTVAVTAGTTYSIQLGGVNDQEAANILFSWSYAATVLWNVAGDGVWDFDTSNWFTQPSGPVSLFADGESAIFNNAAGGTINISSDVSPFSTTVGVDSGNYTFSGAKLSTGSLTKNGTSTLTLATTNSYSGATVVNGGTLVAAGNGALGSSNSFSVATGATLQLNGANAGGYKWPLLSAPLTGGGTVNIALGGQTNVGNNFDMSSFTGVMNISGGMMGLYPNSSPGFVSPVSGTINVGAGTTLYLGWQAGNVVTTTVKLSSSTDNTEGLGVLRGDANPILNGSVILDTNSTIGSAGGTFTINSVISDGGNAYGFTIVGSIGTTVVLNGANTYTGTTTINSGTTLQCNIPASLGGGALSINGKLNLNYGSGTKTVTSLKLSGTVKAPGVYGSSASAAPLANQDDARFAGTGTVTVLPPVVVVGKTVLWNVAGGGDWNFSTSNWFTQPSGPVSNFVNGDDAIFNNSAGGTINIPATVSPLSTTIGAASGDYTFSGAALGGTGSLTKSGLSTLTLNSPNTYSGNTIVNGGTLAANGNGAINGSTSFSVATGSILQLNGTNASNYNWPITTSALIGSGTVNIPLGSNNTNVRINFNMSAFTGNLNLSGVNSMVSVNPVHSPGFTAPAGGKINVGSNTTLYLGWPGTVYNTTVQLSGTGNNEGLGALRGDTATLNGAVVLNTNSTIGSLGGTLTINAVISDGGNGFGFTKVSTGTVTLTATNTYTGPTTVGAGTLRCDIPGALSGGALSINGKLNPNYVGTKTVASLTLGGVAKTAAGTYGSLASGATFQDDTYFTPGSTGTVTVVAMNSFSSWASINAPGQTPSQDYDNDGVQNGMEYFMGQMGSSFTAMPGLDGTNKVTWTKDPTYQGTWQVQTSPDLSTWTNVAGTDTGTSVSYTVPPGMGKQFVRMVVTPAP